MGVDETWNVVLLCFDCHEHAQRHDIEIIGNPDARELRFVTTT